MENRILYVYFGVDRLPYKDPECQVHFPNVGSVINGASNVDTIIFDVSKIGGTNGYQYVSVATLPSGTKLYKTLSGSNNQVSLSISQEYTTQSGDLTIALNSYQGGSEIVVDEDTGLISVEGSPIIVATGSIKLSVAYTPTMESDYNPVSDITVQEALALVGSKASLDYVKFGRVKEELHVQELPIVDYHQVDLDTYEPTSEEDTTSLFENGLPVGIYSVVNGSFLMTGSPTFYHDNLGGLARLSAVYRKTNEENTDSSAHYLCLMLSPNNKFYFISLTNQQVYGDEYASKNLVELMIKLYGTNGNVLTISDLTTPLTTEQQAKIERQDCVIRYSNYLYYRSYGQVSANVQDFTSPMQIVDNTNLLLFNYKCIRYSKNNHTFTNRGGAFSLYSQNYVRDRLGQKLSIDSDYKLSLVNGNNQIVSTIDLPLESVVVSGTYDDETETIILTLQGGSTIDIPVHDLVEGLATTTQLESGLDTKVDKVQGKGLSTNDFTDADKTKVDNSATTSELTSGLETKQDTLVSGTNIKTINNESILGSGNITIQSGGTWGNITGDIQDQTDLQNELQAIREEAEGKTQTFTLSYLDTVAVVQAYLTANPDKKIVDESGNDITSDFLADEYSGIIDNSIFNSQSASLTPTTPSYLLVQTASSVVLPSGAMYVLYDITKIKTGDNVYVLETDVPDRWFRASDLSFRVLETQKVDLTNYVTTNTDQTINAIKTTSSELHFKNSNSQVINKIFTDIYGAFSFRRDGNTAFTLGGSDSRLFSRNFLPSDGNVNYSIGSLTAKWKDLYLSGVISDGTNSVSVADLANLIAYAKSQGWIS